MQANITNKIMVFPAQTSKTHSGGLKNGRFGRQQHRFG
jgi:hypothetical protein